MAYLHNPRVSGATLLRDPSVPYSSGAPVVELALDTLGVCRSQSVSGAIYASATGIEISIRNAGGASVYYSASHNTDASGLLARVDVPALNVGDTAYVSCRKISDGLGFGPIAIVATAKGA